MKGLTLLEIVILGFIATILAFGVVPYTPWGNPNYSFLHFLGSLDMFQQKDYTSAAMEAEKQRILEEHHGQTSDLTDEERHKVLYKEYEEADNIPDFAYAVTLVLICSGFGAIYGRSSFHVKVSLICCLILLFFSWKLIALALFLDVVIIPTLMVMGLKGLFGK